MPGSFEVMRLLHLSDTHLHAQDAQTHHPDIDAAGRLLTVLDAAAAHGPFDAIALTGDICDDGSREGAEAVRAALTTAYPGVPVLAAPGNHDLTDVVTDVFGMPPAHLGDWRVVVAATNVPHQIEGEAGPVVEALAALDPSDTSPVLLLQHHPMLSNSTHDWFVLREGERLAAAFGAVRQPVVVLTGHTHEAFESREGLVHHLGAPSTYYAIAHDGEEWMFVADGTGARVIELGADGRATSSLVLA